MALNWFNRPTARHRGSSPAEKSDLDVAAAAAAAVNFGSDPQNVGWPDVVRQLGQEVASSLNAASEQLDRLNRLEPGLVRSLAPVSESVERARQAGMAAQHVLRLCEDPPKQQREQLNLADVTRAALTARAEWLTRRKIHVRQGMTQTQVYADSSMLYMLVDELLMWAGTLSNEIAVSVDKSRSTGHPRLRVAAWCVPSAVPTSVWQNMRWVLWHQLAHTVGAQAHLSMQEDHVRVTLAMAPVTEQQLTAGAEENAGPSSVSAVIQGCRVLIVSTNAQRRAQCLHALSGYGLVLDSAADLGQAEREAAQHLPDAVVYDHSVSGPQIERLREGLLKRSGTPAAFIEIHDEAGATEFQASTIGAISTGHVAAKSLNQALGPALVFELCKVM